MILRSHGPHHHARLADRPADAGLSRRSRLPPPFRGRRRARAGDASALVPGDEIELHPDPAGAATRLGQYFAGQLDAVDAIDVELNGTPFQKRVWHALGSVRAGTTAAYVEIARAIAAPTAVRAVGAANGANPVAVIVPCHRVIGSNRTLTGYGGGLDRKRWLLEHEGLRPDGLAGFRWGG